MVPSVPSAAKVNASPYVSSVRHTATSAARISLAHQLGRRRTPDTRAAAVDAAAADGKIRRSIMEIIKGASYNNVTQ